MIRSVLNSISIYQISMNVMAKGVKNKLYGLFSQFLWGSLVDKKKMHLVRWGTVTVPVYEGGPRILDMGGMNKTLAAKYIYSYYQGWS